MINIDTRLMDLVKNKTITSDDFFILLCITKRVSKRNESFPSIEKLEEESNFGRKKVYKCLANLANKNMITKKQRHIKGRLSSNLYTIETDYLSVFISAKSEELEEGLQYTQNRHTESLQYTQNEQAENEQAENDTISINQSIEVLTNLSEVLDTYRDKPLKKDKPFSPSVYAEEKFNDCEIKNMYLEYLQIRKIKKWATTKLIVDRHYEEIAKTGSKEKALELIETAILKNWQGLKADWLSNPIQKQKTSNYASNAYISNR